MYFGSVSIILGATDEDEVLYETVDALMQYCDRKDIDKIIIVKAKDVSEGTEKAILKAKEKYAGYIEDFFQELPYVGGAVQDALKRVKSTHVMLFASDMAISLECAPVLIEGAKKNPDIIYKVSRWMRKDSFHNYSKSRKVLNKAAQHCLKFMYGAKVSDFTNPVQIAPAKLYRSINWKELGFPFLFEMVIVPLRLGCKFVEIPGNCYGRQIGKSKNSSLQTAKYLLTAFRVRFTPKNRLMKKETELQ